MKKLSKLLFALVTVLCVALAALAFAGCQGETGATGPQGPVGENGAPGKSAYEIAVENGFEGTVDEWLASLKGQAGAPGQNGQDGAPGQDLTACEHTYGDVIMMIEPTGVTDGFGYEECSECGNQHIVVIPKIAGIDIRNPLALTLDENGKCVVENLGGTMYVSFPAAQSGRLSVSFSTTDEEPYPITWGAELEAFYTANEYAPNGVEENENRMYESKSEWYDGDTVVLGFAMMDNYKTFELSTSYVGSYETFDHTFTINGSNYAGITAVQVGAEFYGNFWPEAEGALVDGQVTLSFVPGEYEIRLIGLDDTKYVLAENSSELETALPIDGSNDQGSNYTYYFLAKNDYTINVVKDGAPVEGAKVGIYNANLFTEEDESYVPDYYGDNVENVTTGADGSATVTLLDAVYNLGGTDTVGFFYLAKIDTFALGFAEYANDVILNPSVDNGVITISIETAEVATLSETEVGLTFYSDDESHSIAYATLNLAEAGNYVLSLGNAINNADYEISTNNMIFSGTGSNGTASIMMKELTAGNHIVTIKVNSIAVTLNGRAPVASVSKYEVVAAFEGSLIGAGAVDFNDGETYTFKATVPGTYTFTFDTDDEYAYIDFYNSKEESDANFMSFFWEGTISNNTYTVELDANEYFTFYVLTNDGDPKTVTIEAPATPTATELTTGSNNIASGAYYTFTAEEAGVYVFEDLDRYNFTITIWQDVNKLGSWIWDFWEDGETFEVTLAVGETYTVYLVCYGDGEGTLDISAK